MFSEFRKACKKLVPEYAHLLELPPEGIADLALPCFSLAKEQKRSPADIAKDLAAVIRIPKGSLVKKVEASGPYVNFFLDYAAFSPVLLKAAIKPAYGKGRKRKEKVMIESPGPNTNKPLHLGHIRNAVLGTAVSNIFEFSGCTAIKVDIINDRGVHICKSMLAYEKLGNGKLPDKKPDHFVGDFYVLFARELENKPGTEEELRQMLVDWERNGKKVRALWRKMNSWVYEGFKETYRRLGIRIDKPYYESGHYLDGKKIALDGVKSGVFRKDEDGNVIADLENHGLGKRVLLRADGTTVYLTQDLALDKKRYRDFKMDKMIHVVGAEQVEHFRALFKIFQILGYPFAGGCYHLAYGMVNLPEGKMKSREGTVVDADDLMDETRALAEEELKKRDPEIKKTDLDARAEKIAMAAIKYYMLKFDAMKTITYDPKKSLEFEGDTGPYLLYAYARCKSILKRSKMKLKIGALGSEEERLVKKLSMFPEAIHASSEYKPHVMAAYAFDLAALFNEYYHSVKVIGSENEKERLALVAAVSNVLKSSLRLMGIETLEKM